MHPNNSNYCNRNIHVNPVFSYLARKHSSTSKTLAHCTPRIADHIESYASSSSKYNVNNSFRNFIISKFNELKMLMYQDQLKESNSDTGVNSSFSSPTQISHPSCDIANSTETNDVTVPFHSTFSKGWFFHNSCDTKCVNSGTFDIQSCCFINEQCLPQNTLNMNDMKKQVLDFYKSKTLSNENSTFVSVSKHKLIRKSENTVKTCKRKYSDTMVLCTRSKLIRRKPELPILLQKSEKLFKNPKKNYIIKRHSVVRINNAENVMKTVCRRKSSSSSSPVVVLNKRKLIRKNQSPTREIAPLISISRHKLRRKVKQSVVPEKLVSINASKLVRSSLLLKNAKPSGREDFFAKSVLYHVIRHRRRTHRGSGYVLLTRNKLIKKAKYMNRTWKQNKTENPSKPAKPNKMFVSLGSNKLIRKTLFAKNNKNVIAPIPQPLKNKLFVRMLNSPSRRIQRFTNHMTRMQMKYVSDDVKNRLSTRSRNRKLIRRKKNTICPIFRQKGTCAKLLKGECFHIHDRKYVMLCKDFIRDKCEEKGCLLSHDLTSKKISICRRFICDNCHREDCPYLHVKPALEASICASFLRGYCENGETCTNWHVFACPEFKKSSQCAKGDACRLPHRTLSYFEGKTEDSDDEDGNWRYFKKNKIDDETQASFCIIPERLSLGELPDYIPI